MIGSYTVESISQTRTCKGAKEFRFVGPSLDAEHVMRVSSLSEGL